MRRVGWGGVVLYEQVFTDAPDALKSFSPEFMARVQFTAAECARLGLSLEVNVADPDRTPAHTGDEVIDPAKIVDLTDRFTPDGKLEWDAPPGRWTIMRFGHTATGAVVKHGRPESKGLECDKMSVGRRDCSSRTTSEESSSR